MPGGFYWCGEKYIAHNGVSHLNHVGIDEIIKVRIYIS